MTPAHAHFSPLARLLHWTIDPDTKPLPFTVSVKSLPWAAVLVGLIEALVTTELPSQM